MSGLCPDEVIIFIALDCKEISGGRQGDFIIQE